MCARHGECALLLSTPPCYGLECVKRAQAHRLGRALEALEAPYLFAEGDLAAGAWRVLHVNAPAAAALGAPALHLPAPLWSAFTAVGPKSEVRR